MVKAVCGLRSPGTGIDNVCLSSPLRWSHLQGSDALNATFRQVVQAGENEDQHVARVMIFALEEAGHGVHS